MHDPAFFADKIAGLFLLAFIVGGFFLVCRPWRPRKPKLRKDRPQRSHGSSSDNSLATGLVDVMITDMWVNH